MNPDTNRFEQLQESTPEQNATMQRLVDAIAAHKAPVGLVRPDGSPVPVHWTTFFVGEHVVIKNYTFKVAYIGEAAILFEPVGPVVLSKADR